MLWLHELVVALARLGLLLFVVFLPGGKRVRQVFGSAMVLGAIVELARGYTDGAGVALLADYIDEFECSQVTLLRSAWSTYNSHLITYLSRVIRRFRPTRLFSSTPFEWYNGLLGRIPTSLQKRAACLRRFRCETMLRPRATASVDWKWCYRPTKRAWELLTQCGIGLVALRQSYKLQATLRTYNRLWFGGFAALMSGGANLYTDPASMGVAYRGPGG